MSERLLSVGPVALEGNRQQRRAAARRSRKVAALGSGAMLAASAAGVATTLMSAAPASAAAPIVVTSLADDGTGTTLREAIDQANTDAGQDTITFQTGLTGTITLASDLPHITDAVDIQGPGASAITVSGADTFAIFNFYDISSSAGANSVSGLTVAHGVANNDDSSGGGIVVRFGSADTTISNAAITNNHASNDGGGVQFYNAVGSMLITGTAISGNTADGGGGGLYADNGKGTLNVAIQNSTISGNTAGSDGGGLYFDQTNVTITDSQVTGNSAGSNGGGISQDGGSLNITNSSVSGNQSPNDGGGLFLYNANPTIVGTTISGNTTTGKGGGGGLRLYDDGTNSTFTMRNSTVSGNTANYYGGGFYIDISGASTIENSTISGNTANQAGGIYGAYGGLTLTQTTITNNTATTPDTAVGGIQVRGPSVINSAGSRHAAGATDNEKKTAHELAEEAPRAQKSGVHANAIGTVDSVGTIIAGNVGEDVGVYGGTVTLNSDHSVLGTVGAAVTVNNLGGTQSGVANPGLAPLANNGGPTQTHALLAGSVALNNGPVPVPVFPGNGFDQRGPDFLRVVDGVVDVGAFEVQPPPAPPTPSPLVIQPRFTG
ncbi:MAG: hypothetical protein QOF40_2030 [Actinomycetota bacterium]|nr:hypothetical protein [Actinomycetota bacterium]